MFAIKLCFYILVINIDTIMKPKKSKKQKNRDKIKSYNIKNTHLFNLLERKLLKDIEYENLLFDDNSNIYNNKKYTKSNVLSKRLNEIMLNQEYKSSRSILNKLNFSHDDNFILISTNDITDCLRHTDTQFDRVLHQTKLAVFEKFECPAGRFFPEEEGIGKQFVDRGGDHSIGGENS